MPAATGQPTPQVLLEAIGRLEQAVAGDQGPGRGAPQDDLREMASAITRTKTEIASIQRSSRSTAACSPPRKRSTRSPGRRNWPPPTFSAAAEHIQESAWTLREEGANPELCDDLDRRATEIYTACSFQDITAQRTREDLQTLRYLEGRINAMIAIWGSTADVPESRRPPRDLDAAGEARAELTQNDVDSVIVNDALVIGPGLADERRFALSRAPLGSLFDAEELAFVDVAPEPSASAGKGAAEPHEDPAVCLDAFADIDALDMREKLKRFT